MVATLSTNTANTFPVRAFEIASTRMVVLIGKFCCIQFTGEYQRIDDIVGQALNPFLTSKGKKISSEYTPLYDLFDWCMLSSDADCLSMMFKRFHNLDRQLTEQTTNRRVRKANERFDRNMFRDGKHFVNTIRQGHEDLARFNEDHKRENQNLYDTEIDELKRQNGEK